MLFEDELEKAGMLGERFRLWLMDPRHRCMRRDCAHVADHRAFTGAVEDATGTRDRVLDVLGLRQSGDDVVHVLAGLGE